MRVNQVICDAIYHRSVLEFTYHGHPRTVEPHAYGVSWAQNEVLRCYQTDGTSRSGMVPCWRWMMVGEIESIFVSKGHFVGERTGYARGDKGMSTIFCEL